MAIKKYSKVKFTLRKELIFILAGIVVLLVATILLNLPNEDEKFVKKWQNAGSQITEKTLYTEISFEGLKTVLESTEGYTFVLFATPDAGSVTYFDTLISLTSKDDYNVSQVYLVDCAFAVGDRENDKALNDTLNKYEEMFKNAVEGQEFKLDDTPNFWVFEGTKLVGSADKYNDVNAALSQLLTFGAKKSN